MSARHSSPFARKPIETLLKEMEGGERLHRVLGPLELTSLGVGATIGTGIYVLTGEVAHNLTGPSLVLAFLLAGVGCGFAALCYSELASMVPVAGSAYTYAYATLGELIAWIIGWDLVLEYAIGSSAVANGWSSYFSALTKHVLGLELDPRFLRPPFDFANGEWFRNMVTLSSGETVQAWVNLPAVFITVAITIILVIGVKESAGFNAAMVLLNIAVILADHWARRLLREPGQLAAFLARQRRGWLGVTEGAARITFSPISASIRSRPIQKKPETPSATWRSASSARS